MKPAHPDDVLKTLKENVRVQKQRNLDIIHKVCADLHQLGSSDFSLATVGRISEERGGMSRKALYNKTSTEFQQLVQAWADYGKTQLKRAEDKPRQADTEDDGGGLLRKIADPALRALFGGIVAERNRLRAEINLLRANANVVIDRRVLPGYVDVTPQGQVVQVIEGTSALTETEKRSLAKAIDPDALRQEGWAEGRNGEILNARGRVVFDMGFANAIRKVLSA